MASYLRAVTRGSSSSESDSNIGTNELGKRLAKWALIIGVPTAVCVAAYLVYRQQEKAKKNLARRPTPIDPTKKVAESKTENADDEEKVNSFYFH